MSPLYKSPCYCTNLRRSANFITDYYDNAMKQAGLTAAQYYLLINLFRLQKANITHWAQRVGLDRSTMVRNIKVLENRGFIEITEGHGKMYRLSALGVETLEAAMPLWNEAQRKMEVLLGEKDIEALMRIADKLQMLDEL